MQRRRSLNWIVLVGLVLASVVAVGAATALAARSAASPFELVFEGRDEAVVRRRRLFWLAHTSGRSRRAHRSASIETAVDLPDPRDVLMHYTCSDGSGSLTLRIGSHPWPRSESGWTIAEGSGRYAGLRGKGKSSSEALDGDDPFALVVPFRATFQGFADADGVPPSLALTSARATKLRGTGRWYAIRVALSRFGTTSRETPSRTG